MTISPFRALDYFRERAAYLFYIPRAVHNFEHAFSAVVILERFRLPLVCNQPLLNGLWPIIGALDKFAAIVITDAYRLGRMLEHVICFAAGAAYPAPSQAVQQNIRTDIKIHYERT
jgi:hypothetical protein